MGTTRIKVIDLSSSEKEIKTARKHAEKLTSVSKFKQEKKAQEKEKAQIAETAETKSDLTESQEQNISTSTTPTADVSEKVTDSADSQAEKKPESTPKSSTHPTPAKKTSTHHKGAKYQKAASLIEQKNYTPKEAFTLLPQTSFTKFDPTVEVHLGLSEKNLKVTVNMPYLKADKKQDTKYLIFADPKTLPKEINVIWGDDKTIEEIEKGTIKAGRDFTLVIASPKYMPKIAKVAKILGPKGLMPNPKNQTVTDNIEVIFEKSSPASGTIIKSDPTAPVIHTKIGKLSQKPQELEENFKALVTSIGISKIKKATLTTTMGPAIQIDPSKLITA